MPDSPAAHRIAYLASGEGRLIETCVQAVDRGLFPGLENACLVTDRECGALGRPSLAVMPRQCLDFARFSNRDEFDAELQRVLAEHRADLLFLTFNRLLGPSLVEAFAGRALNVHLSLLPAFPGFGALEHAVAAGVRFAGSTIHLVDEGVDTGPIITQAAVPAGPADTPASLAERLFPLQQRMALYSVFAISQDQLEVVDGRAAISYADYSAWPVNPVPRDQSLASYVERHLA